MSDIMKRVSKNGVVPVVVLNDAAKAKPLAQAFINGGLDCVEVTFRTDAAAESIKIMSETFPELLVGAGTVLTPEQAQQAMDCGAKFIVSPGLNPEVVKYCQSKGVPILPGISSPTELELAMSLGLEIVKFFPAENIGGLAMIKAMSAPYTKMKFMPTGGISPKNIKDYISFDKIVACGGSWMCPANLINEDKFDEITILTKEAVQLAHGFHVKHLGINCENETEATNGANQLADLFGLTINDANSSIFTGSLFEVMKMPFLGQKGHVAIGTYNVQRARDFLEYKGVKFNEETAKYKDGKLQVIYLQEEVMGFAIHLIKA